MWIVYGDPKSQLLFRCYTYFVLLTTSGGVGALLQWGFGNC